MSELDDLTKQPGGAIGDLLGGLGGGGLGSVLGGILGGGGGAARGGGLAGGNPMLRMLLPMVASLLMNGGLQKILGRLQQQGKGAKGQSWVSTGANEPVDSADIRDALDDGGSCPGSRSGWESRRTRRRRRSRRFSRTWSTRRLRRGKCLGTKS